MGGLRTVEYFRTLVDNFALPNGAADTHHVAKTVLLDAFGKTKKETKQKRVPGNPFPFETGPTKLKYCILVRYVHTRTHIYICVCVGVCVWVWVCIEAYEPPERCL